MGLSRKAARLYEPDIDEISGVDAPAHLAKGWIVMKAAELAGLDDELMAAAEAAADEGGTVGNPTDPIDPAGAGAGTGEPAEVTPEALATAQKAATDAQAVAKAATDQLAALKAAVLGGSVDPEAVAKAEEAEAFEKALATLPEPVAKAWRADRVRLDEAERIAKAEREARLDADYTAVAKSEFEFLAATKPEELGKMLRAIDEKLPEATAKELRRVMKAAAAAEATKELTREYGGAGAPEGSPLAALTAKAAEIRKSESGLSEAQAFDKAVDQNPELAKQYSSTNGR